jgi:hypothetical protein
VKEEEETRACPKRKQEPPFPERKSNAEMTKNRCPEDKGGPKILPSMNCETRMAFIRDFSKNSALN